VGPDISTEGAVSICVVIPVTEEILEVKCVFYIYYSNLLPVAL
jgi:hypothetical protein